jgi:adenylylsulfate kinase
MSSQFQQPSISESGWAIWLTGPPAAGKTTLAGHLQRRVQAWSVPVLVLDSDLLRPLLAPGAKYSAPERQEFYARLVKLAELLVFQGANVIIAATAHRRTYRDAARACLPTFAEVWVHCPLDLCRQRDTKGLYAQALAGEIRDLPGVDLLYEAPMAPELMIDSSRQSPEEAVDFLFMHISFLRRITNPPF